MEDDAYKEAYERLLVTPVNRKPDRRASALSMATIRDDWEDGCEIHRGSRGNFVRAFGCEGTNVVQWLHLIKQPGVHRGQLGHETTLRGSSDTLRPSPDGTRSL